MTTDYTLTRAGELAERLADAIEAPPVWWAAMHRSPRHLYVPRRILAGPPGGPDRLIDRDTDPDAWWRAVYSDTALVTQLDDGATDLSVGAGNYTCSCSAPSVVLAFLELLAPGEGDRVLEIGTGTGWTAGLLSARHGAEQVTTIEVDPVLAAQAEASLAAAGYRPRVVVGDGALGYPAGAPYDRVHVTCAVRDIPYAWVEQTRPGGVIVLPWSPGIGHGHQLRLEVQPDGTALGRIHGGADYMVMRSQRRGLNFAGDPDVVRTTTVDPRKVAETPDAALAVVAGVPKVTAIPQSDAEGTFTWWLSDGGSWATARVLAGEDEVAVRQRGERRLWGEVEAAYERWLGWGRPGADRYGVTLTEEGLRLWLDDPGNAIA